MTPHQFIAKWQAADLKERAACQEHFLDLCAVLGEPTPAAADPSGTWFTFEKGVSKDTGGQGFADVWRRNCFGWEYKGKRKDLKDAYRQLCKYRESLLNPPLLVVCDLERLEIHTNFASSVSIRAGKYAENRHHANQAEKPAENADFYNDSAGDLRF